MDNFDLKKYLAEGRLFKEAKTPRYPEGKLSIKDKIKAIVPLWRQYLQSDDRLLQSQIKDKINKYTTYDDEFGGGSYVFDILDNAQSIEDVAKIVMKNEKDNNISQQQYSVELLVPTIYFNVETKELAKSKYDFGAESELEDMDITSYSDGEELIEWVFDNSLEKAKYFEREYPGLFKVVTRNSRMLREYSDYKPGSIAPADLYYSDKHGKLVALDDVDDKYHDSLKNWLVVRKGDKVPHPED